jgi:hypothetical protein
MANVQLGFIDPDGEGTPYPAPYPSGNQTIYNGTTGCQGCGLLLGPVQALHSDLCPSCVNQKASRSASYLLNRDRQDRIAEYENLRKEKPSWQ